MLDKIKILIVDDAPTMRSVIKGALVNAGFVNFDEADNGLVALDKLNKDEFHLVLCDLDMPKMDGLGVLRDMRTTEKLENIPLIIISAIAKPEKVIQLIEEGVNDYIIKPIKPDALVQRVKDVLKDTKVI